MKCPQCNQEMFIWEKDICTDCKKRIADKGEYIDQSRAGLELEGMYD